MVIFKLHLLRMSFQNINLFSQSLNLIPKLKVLIRLLLELIFEFSILKLQKLEILLHLDKSLLIPISDILEFLFKFPLAELDISH